MWLLAVAEYRAKEPAGRSASPPLELFDPTLRGDECMLLRDDCFGHVVWRAWLPFELLLDEPAGIGIARPDMPLDFSELAEQLFDRLAITMIHLIHRV